MKSIRITVILAIVGAASYAGYTLLKGNQVPNLIARHGGP
jgi:hypothetical protein